MASFPERITDDTFEQAWAYTVKRYRGAKRRFVMEAPISWLANTLFFCGAILVSLGVMIEDVPVAAAYAQSLPRVGEWWEMYRTWLLGLNLEPRHMQVLTVGLLFLIPLAAGIPISLLVRLVYHPKGLPTPEGTRKEKAWELRDAAKKAYGYTHRATHNGGVLFAALFALACFGFLAYVLLGSAYAGNALVETDFETSSRVAYWIIGMFFAYGLLGYVLRLLITPLYYYSFSGKVMTEIDRYWSKVSAVEENPEPSTEQKAPEQENHEVII